MNQSEIKKKEDLLSSWEEVPMQKEQQLTSWQHSAFQAALEQLKTGHGTPDSVMRMGEAFGRGLFAERIKDKTPDWTMKQWLQEIEKDVCEPLGTEFTFTKISPDVATTFMNRNPLAQTSQDQTAASLFHFGVMRGLFRSAFPQGELVISELKDHEQPEFIFKANASAKDKLERERIIRALTFLKIDDGV